MLNTEDPAIQQITHNFSSSAFTRRDIDERSVYVKAGKGPSTLRTINRGVKWKFPSYSFPPLAVKMLEEDVISFAYLYKKIKFSSKFTRRVSKTFKFNGK